MPDLEASILGQRIQWSSASGGYRSTKRGTVVGIKAGSWLSSKTAWAEGYPEEIDTAAKTRIRYDATTVVRPAPERSLKSLRNIPAAGGPLHRSRGRDRARGWLHPPLPPQALVLQPEASDVFTEMVDVG